MASNSKIVALDTCIILRLILQDVPEQYELAKDLILNGQDFYVDQAVVSEAVYVLQKLGYERAEIVENVSALLKNPMFIYDKTFFDPIFEKFATHPSLSFNDCVLEARAEAKNCLPLWTFDQKFAKQSEAARLLTY